MKNKNILVLICLSILINFQTKAQIAVNNSGAAADSSTVLDINSTNKGLLIPRVSISTVTDNSTISNPATSLLIYNTNTGLAGDNADGVGYYYNAGTSASPSWTKLASAGLRWDDLRVTLDKGANSASLDYLSGSSGPQIWYFRNNQAVEAMSFTVQLPHTWKEGSIIYPHLHWVPRSTASGAGSNIIWNFEYTWANYNASAVEAFPSVTTSSVTAYSPFTQNGHYITPLTSGNVGISGTGKKISSILICRIWRNSDNSLDTYNSDAGVLFLDFHIQIDGYGSHEEYSK